MNTTTAVTISEQWDKYCNENVMDRNALFEDGTTPLDWEKNGFSPTDCQFWMSLGAFDMDRIREIESIHEESDFDFLTAIALPITDEDIEQTWGLSHSYKGYTLAYLYCNGAISKEELKGFASQL